MPRYRSKNSGCIFLFGIIGLTIAGIFSLISDPSDFVVSALNILSAIILFLAIMASMILLPGLFSKSKSPQNLSKSNNDDEEIIVKTTSLQEKKVDQEDVCEKKVDEKITKLFIPVQTTTPQQVYANDDEWWESLSAIWKKRFNKIVGIKSPFIEFSNVDFLKTDEKYINEKSVRTSGTTKKPPQVILKSITMSTELDLSGFGIIDISCLSYLKSLRSLNLSYNRITDFTPITDLEKLSVLIINGDSFNDRTIPLREISFIRTLKNLIEIDLSNNKITSIYPLIGLDSLERLTLNNNEIKNIKGLENKERLKYLKLGSNIKLNVDNKILRKIKNLEELEINNLNSSAKKYFFGLKKIKSVKLSNSNINLQSLISHRHLSRLELINCKKIDLKNIKHLKQLELLKINFMELGITSFLKNLENLKTLDLEFCKIHNINAIKYLKNLENLNLNSNNIKNLKSLEGLDKLQVLKLEYNELTICNIESLKKIISKYEISHNLK